MNGNQFCAIFLGCCIAAYVGSLTATESLGRALAQTVGNGSSVTISCTDTTLTCNGSGGVALATAQPNPITWNASQGFTNFINSTYVPTTACQTNAPIADVCLGSPTATAALAIGHQIDAWGGTAADNSGQLRFYWGTGSAERYCALYAGSGTNGFQTTGTAACPWALNGNLAMGGNNISGVTKFTQNATGDIWASCAMAAGTTCTVTWTYTPTFCTAGPLGATAYYAAVGISGTTETVTANASNSATWDVSCQ